MNPLQLPLLESRFPRAAFYRDGARTGQVCESATPFPRFPYRERHLQCLWADERLRPAKLATSGGEPVEVEQAGDWNLEAGPDFRNAVLLVGKEKRRICGDLEIHIHPAAWKQHGHAGDPRYARVRFHIVYFQGLEIPGLLQIPLQQTLASDPRFSFENIDLSAYPYSIPTGDFPLAGIDPDRKIQWLESAGEERLRLKTERLALALQTKEPNQLLWEELLAALGYKNNKAPFRRIAATLPLARLRSLATTPNEAYALLLGLSGLLPANPAPSWDNEAREFFRQVWDFWWKQNEELKELTLKKAEWNLAGLRPANHPIRRLMAAAHYAFHIPEVEPAQIPANFWTTHIGWKTPCKPTALVGQARANAIATNILIPFQAATGATELDLHKLPPEPSNQIIRQTAHALFGPDHTSKVYKSALARQGLIQIFHDYLTAHRTRELNDVAAFLRNATKPAQTSEHLANDKGASQKHRYKSGSQNRLYNKSGSQSRLCNKSASQKRLYNDGSSENRLYKNASEKHSCAPPKKYPGRPPRLARVFDPTPLYYVTFNSWKRHPLLANDTVHAAFRDYATKNLPRGFAVGRYVIMPDHIHLLVRTGREQKLDQYIRLMKQALTKTIRQTHPEERIWQPGFFDHVLRSSESYSEKGNYIRMNPVRAGLVEHAEEWKFAGEMVPLFF